MIYETLTSEEVTSVHKLYKLLRNLRVIGVVYTSTEQMKNSGVGHPIRYKIKFDKYDPTMKGKLTPEEKLDQAFRFYDLYTRRTE